MKRLVNVDKKWSWSKQYNNDTERVLMRNKRSNIRREVEISGFASDCFVKSQSQEVIFMDSNPKSGKLNRFYSWMRLSWRFSLKKSIWYLIKDLYCFFVCFILCVCRSFSCFSWGAIWQSIVGNEGSLMWEETEEKSQTAAQQTARFFEQSQAGALRFPSCFVPVMTLSVMIHK